METLAKADIFFFIAGLGLALAMLFWIMAAVAVMIAAWEMTRLIRSIKETVEHAKKLSYTLSFWRAARWTGAFTSRTVSRMRNTAL